MDFDIIARRSLALTGLIVALCTCVIIYIRGGDWSFVMVSSNKKWKLPDFIGVRGPLVRRLRGAT